MAIDTVLHHWRVLPQERATPFGVATQAILINGRLPELSGIWCAMRVMAACAGYFAFAVRHVRRALQLCSAHLMTPEAELRLSFF
jgi:hypothetical protein